MSADTYMPQVVANFAGLGDTQYLIDNNAAISYAWTTVCEQTAPLADNVMCSLAPSYVNETLNES